MISITNIRSVARYEAKTLRRSWLFRLFAIASLLILGIMNIAVFSPVGDQDWESLAIPATIPHINLYLLNIAQALIIIFLASDFIKRDKKLDTNEVLYTRPVSNFEYIIGKTTGILKLFIGLNLLILLIALIVNLTAKNTRVDIAAYLTHLLIISLPTLIYSLGLAYVIMSLVRNQAITFLLLLGYAALNLFYLWYRAGFFFDYMLFGMPVFKSAVTGYSNLWPIIAHRLFYTSLGIAFIMITILTFKRLPHSRSHAVLSIVILIGSIITATISGIAFNKNNTSLAKARDQILETNSRYENELFVTITEANVDLEHSGEKIDATATLTCSNRHDETAEQLIFSLNPLLTVTSATFNGQDVQWERDHHILKITPPSPPAPGEDFEVSVSYNGTIEEEYTHPWHDPDYRTDNYKLAMVNIEPRQAYVTEDFVLLTPETGWYPVAGLNFYPTNPARQKVDFTSYTLKVKSGQEMVPVSQGRMTKEGDAFLFKDENPLTGLTVAIGNYQTDSLKAGDITYSAWYFPGHDYFRDNFTELSDTIEMVVKGVMDELAVTFSSDYPFNSLKLVEVPVHFRTYPKKSTQTMAEVQPSMILLPEKMATINSSGFSATMKRQQRMMERNNQVITEKELQVRVLNQFIRSTFISSNDFRFRSGQAIAEPGRFLLGPSFYYFKNNFYSDNYPVINAVFETHLQKVDNMGRNMARGFLGGLSEGDKANTILKDISLENLLAANPSNDTLRIVMTVKGDYLFSLMRYNAGVTRFNNWFKDYIEATRFTSISLEQFNRDLTTEFGFNLEPLMEEWFRSSGQPGFLFTDIKAEEIVVDNRTRYLVSFVASNPEETGGLFNVIIRSGGPGGGGGRGAGASVSVQIGAGGRGNITAMGMQGRGMQTDEIDRIVWLGPGEAKRVSIIKDGAPRGIGINTIFSLNNPGEINFPFPEITKSRNSSPTEGEELLESIPPYWEENEFIVDNEDPGFRVYEQESSSRLKEWLNISRDKGNEYSEAMIWWAPEHWQKTVQGNYYGRYIKSATYTRSGDGERYVTWTAPVESPGYYDIYTYIGKTGGGRMMMFSRGRDQNNDTEYHYTVSHDDGDDEIIIDYESAENGWNLLGSFYLSPDSARVKLSNLSGGRVVSADAVRWVRQNTNNR